MRDAPGPLTLFRFPCPWAGYSWVGLRSGRADAMNQESTRESLLLRLSGAESGAWDEFHRRYGPLIRSFARRAGLQESDCDDVLQESLVSLTRSLPRFHYDRRKGRFRSYLKTVVLRGIGQKTCQGQGTSALGMESDILASARARPDLEGVWEEEWRRHHVRRALQHLSGEFRERDRLAFQRYALEGRDAQATASELGMSLDHVYQVKSRILKRVAELVAQQVREEG